MEISIQRCLGNTGLLHRFIFQHSSHANLGSYKIIQSLLEPLICLKKNLYYSLTGFLSKSMLLNSIIRIPSYG